MASALRVLDHEGLRAGDEAPVRELEVLLVGEGKRLQDVGVRLLRCVGGVLRFHRGRRERGRECRCNEESSEASGGHSDLLRGMSLGATPVVTCGLKFSRARISATQPGSHFGVSLDPLHDRDRAGDRVEQGLAVHGLAQVGGGTRREDALPGLGHVVSCDHDDGYARLRLREPGLRLEAVHVGHVQVEDDAVRRVPVGGGQEVSSGRERRHVVSGDANQARQGLADGFLVVHDGDERPGCIHFQWRLGAAGSRRNWTLVQCACLSGNARVPSRGFVSR